MTIEEAFHGFHKANPHVLDKLVALARKWTAAGNKKASINMFFEVLRWEQGVTTIGSQFTLNNNFRALYARRIMDNNADLAGIFNIRALGGGGHVNEHLDDYEER